MDRRRRRVVVAGGFMQVDEVVWTIVCIYALQYAPTSNGYRNVRLLYRGDVDGRKTNAPKCPENSKKIKLKNVI